MMRTWMLRSAGEPKSSITTSVAKTEKPRPTYCEEPKGSITSPLPSHVGTTCK